MTSHDRAGRQRLHRGQTAEKSPGTGYAGRAPNKGESNHAPRPRREAADARGPARVRLQQAPPLAVEAIPHTRRPTGKTGAAEACTSASGRETAPEFDPDILPRVRPQFRVTTDDLEAKRALQKPAPTPSPRKTTGEDWRAQTLAQRANQAPPRADEPASESESALRAFLDTDKANAHSEAPSAEDEQDPAS